MPTAGARSILEHEACFAATDGKFHDFSTAEEECVHCGLTDEEVLLRKRQEKQETRRSSFMVISAINHNKKSQGAHSQENASVLQKITETDQCPCAPPGTTHEFAEGADGECKYCALTVSEALECKRQQEEEKRVSAFIDIALHKIHDDHEKSSEAAVGSSDANMSLQTVLEHEKCPLAPNNLFHYFRPSDGECDYCELTVSELMMKKRMEQEESRRSSFIDVALHRHVETNLTSLRS